MNGFYNRSQGEIIRIFRHLGCNIMEIEIAAEVGDSGALIYSMNGCALAVLKGVYVEDGVTYGFATLLSELIPYFSLP
jgi:hypothetical protein